MRILHPFSTIDSQENIIISCNNYIQTIDNKDYIDGISGIYNCPLGYSNRPIKDAIVDALDKIPAAHIFSANPSHSHSNLYISKLINTLSDIIPFSKDIFFTNSGSEAVESALLLCKELSPKREKVISYTSSYHGSTSTTRNISGNISLTNELIDFYYFYDRRTKEEYVRYFENKIIEIGPENILAFVAEPFIGASGGFFMKENILPEISKILKKYNIYFILDEVISGFGRLGDMFAYQTYNIIPDILILSKSITNGYMPLSCLITSFKTEIKKISFGFSTGGHPVAAAAAVATIDIISDLINKRVIESKSLELLSSIQNNIENFYHIECHGLFAAFHISSDKDNYMPFDPDLNIGGRIASELYNKGIIVRGNYRSVILSPGYLLDKRIIDKIVSNIFQEYEQIKRNI